MRSSRGGIHPPTDEAVTPELVPELFDAGAERPVTSGQFSAAAVVGFALFAVELLAAPLVLVITVAVLLVTWWLLDAPWAGGRYRPRHPSGITSRVLYLGTLMVVGLWLAVMFIFRASDPALSSGFTTTLPVMIWGVDVSLLNRLNGMESLAQPNSPIPLDLGQGSFAPFSLFVHGTASTVSMSLLAYAVSAARRRLRRRSRTHGRGMARDSRPGGPPPTVR